MNLGGQAGHGAAADGIGRRATVAVITVLMGHHSTGYQVGMRCRRRQHHLRRRLPAADEPVRPIALASGAALPRLRHGARRAGWPVRRVRASPRTPLRRARHRSGRDRAVATRGLGRVEGLVGPLEQLTGALLEVPGGHPNGAGDLGCDGPQPLGDTPGPSRGNGQLGRV